MECVVISLSCTKSRNMLLLIPDGVENKNAKKLDVKYKN